MKSSPPSGAECVEHLRQLGFAVTRESGGLTFLERAACRVVVPAVDVIDGPLLDAILRSAGVDLETFLRVRKQSGAYARVLVRKGVSSRAK